MLLAELEIYHSRPVQPTRRVALGSLVLPVDPENRIRLQANQLEPIEHVAFATENFTSLFERFNFLRFLWNSTFITVTATLLMLLVTVVISL